MTENTQPAAAGKPKTAAKIAAEMHPTTTKHPLIGAGVHMKDHDDCVARQGIILDVLPGGAAGPIVLLQFFEWLGGFPSTRRLIPLEEMAATERWVLYADCEEMADHYERVDVYRIKHRERDRERAERPAA